LVLVTELISANGRRSPPVLTAASVEMVISSLFMAVLAIARRVWFNMAFTSTAPAES
jgi:hypothetical protein